MRFRFASKFGWWIPSEAEECFDLEPWCALWQRPILSHPHPHAYPTRSMTCCWDGHSAAHGFAVMSHCWNTVKLAFLSPEALTSVICYPSTSAWDTHRWPRCHQCFSSGCSMQMKTSTLSLKPCSVHLQQRGFPLKRGRQLCRFEQFLFVAVHGCWELLWLTGWS